MVDNNKSQMDLNLLLENYPPLKKILAKIDQVVWVVDLRSEHILYVSPAFEMVWGRTCESLIADPAILIDSVHPEDRVQVLVAQPQDDHKHINKSYRIIRPDHTIRWIFTRTFLIEDESGKPDFLVNVAQDITGQKEIELALRKALDRSREQFTLSRRMSVARKPESVLKALMSAHELRSAHRSALLFFDDTKVGPGGGIELTAAWQSNPPNSPWLSESNLYEEPAFLDLLQPSQPVVITVIKLDPRLPPDVRTYLLEAQIQTLAIFPLVATGNWLGCFLVYYKHEHSFDHVGLRHLKVLVDQAAVTLYNLKLLKVEEASRHEAERANAIKTEFLGMVSHELRTPLTSIIGFTTTMLAEDVVWEPDEQSDFTRTIQREAYRLQELIEHLLDLSSLEAGMLPITKSAHSLQEIFEDASSQLNILTIGHILTIRLPATLPPVFVDSQRIAQVVVNLVRNSSTYAAKGTEIDISASLRRGFMQINVSDHGPGIQASEHKSVFEAFRRGTANGNGSAQGAGLGLAICKGLVESHGGRIWVKRKTIPGATICFTIPLAELNDPEKAQKVRK